MPYRVRISTLLFVVLLLGLDFAWLRALDPHFHSSVLGFAAPGFDIGVLPMANLLAIGLYFMVRWRSLLDLDPFLWGFESFGAGALLVYMILCWESPKLMVLLFLPLYSLVALWRPLDPADPLILLVGAISFTLPQLLIATLGGYSTRCLARCRARRSHSSV
jgi:hypothetical protein